MGTNVKSIAQLNFRAGRQLVEIDYAGTKAQWNNISKSGWNNGSYINKINCTDGTINL